MPSAPGADRATTAGGPGVSRTSSTRSAPVGATPTSRARRPAGSGSDGPRNTTSNTLRVPRMKRWMVQWNRNVPLLREVPGERIAGSDVPRVEDVVVLGDRMRRAVDVLPGDGRPDEDVEPTRRVELPRHRHLGRRRRRAGRGQRRLRLPPHRGRRDDVLTSSPGRSRSSRSSCDPRRGSGRARFRRRPPSSALANDSAGPIVRVSSEPRGMSQRCPWTWNVWWSSPIVRTSHCTTSPTFARNTGVLPTKARPLTVLKSSCWPK